MLIRNAIETDATGIATVLYSGVELKKVFSVPISETAKVIAENLRIGIESGNSLILVAENEQGDIIGYCSAHWVPFLFWRGGEGYITELFIRPSDTGKQIGTQLLDRIAEEARKRGCARLTLINGRDSEAYRRNFYTKRGWIERDRMANFVLPLSDEQLRVSGLTSSIKAEPAQ